MSVSTLFLSKHTVLEIHEQQIVEQGGDPAIRDEGLPDLALAQPQAQSGGQYLHADLFAMAAAYVRMVRGFLASGVLPAGRGVGEESESA